MTEVNNLERYTKGVLVRYGDRRNQAWTVSWNPTISDFSCTCPKSSEGVLCWHRDEVITQLAIQALEKQSVEEDKGTNKNANKRKLRFDDGK